MKTLDFCGGWQVGYLEGDLREPVTLPHDAMLREKRTQGSAGDVHIGWFEGHDYEYVKCFAASDEMLSGHALVEFEGVYHNAQVYINDVLVAERPYGYSGFYADMTGHLKRCENVLRVLVKNKEQPNSRWYTGSGIYRPVWLHLMPPAHILPHGVRVMTTDYLSRSIRVDIQTSMSGTVKIEFLDGGRMLHSDEKQTQGALSLSYTLPDMELWSPETPKRYLCRVRFGQDEQKVCFGVRAVQCDARNGLRINGELTVLRGACVHHDNGLLGACAYAHAERRKVRLLKEAGFNAIRSAHNPCSRAMLEACDEIGMLDELFFFPGQLQTMAQGVRCKFGIVVQGIFQGCFQNVQLSLGSSGCECLVVFLSDESFTGAAHIPVSAFGAGTAQHNDGGVAVTGIGIQHSASEGIGAGIAYFSAVAGKDDFAVNYLIIEISAARQFNCVDLLLIESTQSGVHAVTGRFQRIVNAHIVFFPVVALCGA